MADSHAAARNAFFQELKPHCIAINNLAVRAADKKAASKELLHEVEELYLLLDQQSTSRDATILDHKLADYVFFPLSNILRNQHEFPIRLVELTIQCITILVNSGWKSKLPADLAQQLLILLTFIIGGVPGQTAQTSKRLPVPEETEVEAYRALNAVIKATGLSTAGAAALVDTNAVPTLGHAVSVILDGITDGRTADVQLEGLNTTRTLSSSIKDRTVLATFLPGIVSSLSRLLSPPIAPKSQRKVLVNGLEVLKDALVGVLSDMSLRSILPDTITTMVEKEPDNTKVLTTAWLKATSSKVQVALAHVLKLRNHTADDVRNAVNKLCLSLLDECHASLANCAAILVETALVLAPPEVDSGSFETSLVDLARIYPELCDVIKTVVYNWETSLSRQMQAGDENTKQQAIHNLSMGHRFISTLGIDSSILQNSLAAALRDAIAVALVTTGPAALEGVPDLLQIENSKTESHQNTLFAPVVLPKSQELMTRTALTDFLRELSLSSQQAGLAETMLASSREASGEQRVASFWLAFELLKPQLSQNSGIDEFLELTSAGESQEEASSVFEELFAYSVSILDSEDENDLADWRMQALAIEAITFAASREGEKFRPELIDVLYPITTFLGSDNLVLRQHAMTSLNSLSASCGYLNVTDLVVENVDYMVNSYSLRLNTFDITPASTQVLRMVIKLTGPRLVPYLDDVVASIFGALDNYHGYPSLVEGLFSVLSEITTQGAQSGSLLITQDGNVRHKDHSISSPGTIDMAVIENRLATALERRSHRLNNKTPHPRQPWGEEVTKTAEELLNEHEARNRGNEDDTEASEDIADNPPPPKTPTYKILERITDLTQHFMTSPTPTLRKSLLELLCNVFPAIAADEGSFLPLVNSIWPVTVERLYDQETFVVLAACKALAALCQSSGDFLSSRFKTEWWDRLGQWFVKKKADAKPRSRTRSKADHSHGEGRDMRLTIRSRPDSTETIRDLESASSPALGQFTHAAQVWRAARELLTALVSFVQIEDAIMERILELVAEDMIGDSELRAALEAIDADSVWLEMYQHGVAHLPSIPEIASGDFVRIS